MHEVFMSIKEYARRAGCGHEYLRRLCQAGVIPSLKIGRSWTIDVMGADAHFREQMQERVEKTAPMRSVPRVTVLRSSNVSEQLAKMKKSVRSKLRKSVDGR